MPVIQLTRGYKTIVDKDDFEYLSQYKWTAQPKHGNVYAFRMSKRTKPYEKRHTIFMHREILKARENFLVDHINHNTLDNRKSNLRECSHSENMRNRVLQINNKYGTPGLTYIKKNKIHPWRVTIRNGEKWPKYIGSYISKDEATIAYREAQNIYHKEFASCCQ